MSEARNYTSLIVQTVTGTIQSGQTKSDIINLKGVTFKTLILPAAFDGTSLTFEISDDGATFYPYYNVNNIQLAITCTQGRAYGLAAIDFYSIQYLKIVSNASETAARSLKLLTRAI